MADAFVPDPKTWYILTFAHSGHVLGAKIFSHENGTPLAQTAYARLGHQQWAFVEIEPGWYQPIMRSSSGTKSFGRALEVWDLGQGSAKQQWAFEPLADGGYCLRNRYENKLLEVEGGSPRAGASVLLSATSNAERQRIDVVALAPSEAFVPEPDAWYTIRFAHSGHVLDVDGWHCTDGSAVVQGVDAETHNQQWSFEELEPGWYILHPRHCPKSPALRWSRARSWRSRPGPAATTSSGRSSPRATTTRFARGFRTARSRSRGPRSSRVRC